MNEIQRHIDAEFENSIDDIVRRYTELLKPLLPFLPWLKMNLGLRVAQDNGDGSMLFPVYDGTLLNFVKTAQASEMMNRNYVYTYTREHLETAEDELRFIERAEIRDMEALGDILSRYMLEGNTKGRVWSEGVTNEVYYTLLTKMESLIRAWSNSDELMSLDSLKIMDE